MAKKTAEVDTREFEKSIKALQKVWEPKLLTAKVSLLANAIIAESVLAPVPRDKGFLAESGTVQLGEREGSVVFGFNRSYAAVQDLGSKSLPAKPYGSDLGPNKYFSETVRRRGPGVLKALTSLLQEDLRLLSAREKRLSANRGKP